MLSSRNDDRLYVIGVQERCSSTDCSQITFLTTRGELRARVRLHKGMKRSVILLGGCRGETGFESAFDLLEESLGVLDVGVVRLDHRTPGDCAQCSIDTLLACQYLDDEGIRDVVLVGWSFGASVAAAAGSVARNVRGIAAISAREATETCTRRLRSKPLLLLHGENDRITPVAHLNRICSRLSAQSRLIVYPGAGHDLVEVRQKLNEDLVDWILRTLDPSQVSIASPVEQQVS